MIRVVEVASMDCCGAGGGKLLDVGGSRGQTCFVFFMSYRSCVYHDISYPQVGSVGQRYFTILEKVHPLVEIRLVMWHGGAGKQISDSQKATDFSFIISHTISK